MAAEVTVLVRAELTGLGKDQSFVELATDGTVPTAVTYGYRTLAVADTEEALDLGDIAVETILVIRAVTDDIDVDLDFSSAFDSDFTLKAGEPAACIPNPAGIVYVKNNGAAETPVYEYLLCGTT